MHTEIELKQTLTLETEECISCGIVFAMTKTFIDHLRYTGQTFWCPNGHGMVYGSGEKEKLQRRIVELENDRDWYKKSLSSTRGELTKLQKRIKNGICPCCHRQFANLNRHMNTKHPDYVKDEE